MVERVVYFPMGGIDSTMPAGTYIPEGESIRKEWGHHRFSTFEQIMKQNRISFERG